MESFSIAPPGGGSRSRKPNDPLLGHCDADAVAAGVRFHHWGLGFRQSSFRPITRALRDGTFSAFGRLPLFGHAVFPSGFRLQVNPMAQKHPSEFLLTASGIQHRVPRRTLSWHPALRSQATQCIVLQVDPEPDCPYGRLWSSEALEPVPLHHVLGITPGVGLLRGLCRRGCYHR